MAVIAFVVALALGMGNGSSGLPRTAASADKAELRRLRSENNEAMVAHNLAGTMQIAADDYVLIGGNDGIHRSKADMQETWSHAFADPKVLPCARRPIRIEVGEYDGIRRAAESGSWECPVRTPRGVENLFGRYLAHWSRRSGSWKVVSDVYVTLGCRGSGCHQAR